MPHLSATKPLMRQLGLEEEVERYFAFGLLLISKQIKSSIFDKQHSYFPVITGNNH
jgi:hypothetical protein